jgi:Na+-driven multidrug efflux pump
MNTAAIVKSAVNITVPIVSVINAVPCIAAIGAGVMYTQAIAKGDKYKANQI